MQVTVDSEEAPLHVHTERPGGRFLRWGPVEVPGFQARHLLRVFVPPGYDERRPHPTLYLFDGQNVFDDAPSFSGGWHVHAAVAAMEGHRQPIVVGIDNGGAERTHELSPWASDRAEGKLDVFLQYLTDRLLPRVRQRFHVLEGPRGATLGGSSLGGLAAIYGHFRRPDAFGGAIGMSSSFWFARRRIVSFVAEQPNPWTSRLYLDHGGLEWRGAGVQMNEELAQVLRARGYTDDHLMVHADPDGQHNERSWRSRVPRALAFHFR